MSATLRPSGALRSYIGERDEIQVESGRTVRETLVSLGIPPELIALVVVNGEQQSKDYVIQEGDVVRVLTVIGGG